MTPERLRILPIPNSSNLRDLGGYPAADGRRVKWRTLYRSGVMAQLGDEEQPALAELGVRTIVDLRANGERMRKPVVWHQGLGVDYWAHDYDLSVGDMEVLAAKAQDDASAVAAFIREVYTALPFELAPQYRELFRRLVEDQTPVLFACSAGKDRTGIAAALILHVLGVPREVIGQDYALTDHVMEALISRFVGDPKFAGFARMDREDYLPIFRSDPSSLEIAFDAMADRHGSVDGYLREVLGVGEAEQDALRGRLLEPA